ncbi:hypothetical protein OC842_003618 [Tilletia horrida]|uniref:Origin recognition complex subunit 5 C-terminal domain-containing protein n=1 Tax=Tilletia horrida TaxID=155126 RepID=A0AAN6GB32_9BASI|nr:hypothetical protein OC842_003618 [Tilletia horrida]KAK0561374.1 hypothetical protein OC844_003249 [Tilletia horrida]
MDESATARRRRIATRVKAQFPGRSTQIDTLVDAFAQPDLAGPSSLLLHDPRSPRHTQALARAVLGSIQTEFEDLVEDEWDGSSRPVLDTIFLSPLLVGAPRLLYRAILTAIDRKNADFERLAPPQLGADDALDTFSALLASSIRRRTEDGDASKYRLCIVVEHAERVRDLWPNHVLLGLLELDRSLRTRDLPSGRVSVVFVVSTPWIHFRDPDGNITSSAPESIFFPPLAKSDACAYLKLNTSPLYHSYKVEHDLFSSVDNSYQPLMSEASGEDPSTALITKPDPDSERRILNEAEFTRLFESFCEIAYHSLCGEAADIVDMQLLSAAVWHVFLVPVQTGQCHPSEFQGLFKIARPAFRDVLTHVLSREVSPGEWVEAAVRTATAASKQQILDKQKSKTPGANLEGLGVKSDEKQRTQDREAYGEGDSDDDVAVAEGSQLYDGPIRKKRRIPLAEMTAVPPLPVVSSLLLVSAFVACYNPARLDVARFAREAGMGFGRRKKKGGGTVRGRASALEYGSKSNLGRQQLMGPKAVNMERFLAIFQVLLWEADPATLKEAGIDEAKEGANLNDKERAARMLDVERVARSAAVFQRIKYLIAQRFLLAVGKMDNPTSASIQVNITYEVAQSLAKQVKLKIEDWLHDWKELF